MSFHQSRVARIFPEHYSSYSAYYFKNVTVFTYNHGQVKLFIQVVHYLVNVSVHEYHVEVSEMNITSCFTHEVIMKPTHWHVILCP